MTDKARALLAEYMGWWMDGTLPDVEWVDRVRAYLAEPVTCSTCAAGVAQHIHPATWQCQRCGKNKSDLHNGVCASCWAEPVTAPAGLADAVAAAMPEGPGSWDFDTYDGGVRHGFNRGRAACLAYLRSIEAEPLACTLAEALAVDCAECEGSGGHLMQFDGGTEWDDCTTCNGTGKLPAAEQPARGEYCPDCHGAGEDWCNDKRRCTRCAGSGVVDAEQQEGQDG